MAAILQGTSLHQPVSVHSPLVTSDLRTLPAIANSKTVVTERCYASAVLAMGLCPCLSVSVYHKPVFYKNGKT